MDVAKHVYVILSGEISLAIADPKESVRQIGAVHGGDLMGWSPLVGRMRLYDTARTVTPVKTLEFVGSELMDFCAANPTFGFEFMRRVACVLAERLSGARLQLAGAERHVLAGVPGGVRLSGILAAARSRERRV